MTFPSENPPPRQHEGNAMTASRIITGDCRDALATLPEQSIHCCITSPPYFGLRDYGIDGQIGLEQTPEAFVAEMVRVFREVRRVLRDDGTFWLNLGDSYSAGGRGGGAEGSIQSNNIGSTTGAVFDAWKVPGFKPKNLLGIPWRVALALQADGWYLRQDIIWHKPNPMPESVTDRCTKAHEYVFLMAKSERYYFDGNSIRQPSGANQRSVWKVNTKPFKGAHFATFPTELVLPCVLAGCPAGGTVLDPFNGAGTTGLVALSNGRNYCGIELNPEYVEITKQRLGLLSQTVEFMECANAS
jgi:site-specific DNA-methyltransferase (adenine-specific)